MSLIDGKRVFTSATKHVGRRKRTAADIVRFDIGSINADLSKQQRAVLWNRFAVWLSTSVKSDASDIASVGTGKARRYYQF